MSTSRFTPANHLLPTLFDRLCDNAPYQKIDRGISVTPVQLKEIIRRDLSFLLNTISHEGDIDARRYPQAAASVLNYRFSQGHVHIITLSGLSRVQVQKSCRSPDGHAWLYLPRPSSQAAARRRSPQAVRHEALTAVQSPSNVQNR